MNEYSNLLAITRQRHHIEGHLRTVEQQILDALLRIEELLTTAKFATHMELARETQKEPAVQAVDAEVINTKPGGVTKVRRK